MLNEFTKSDKLLKFTITFLSFKIRNHSHSYHISHLYILEHPSMQTFLTFKSNVGVGKF